MLPELIELPRPCDICKGDRMTIDGQRRCSEEWLRTFFVDPQAPTDSALQCRRAFRHWHKAVIIAELRVAKTDLPLTAWNDHPNTTPEQIADVIERTVEMMGYETQPLEETPC